MTAMRGVSVGRLMAAAVVVASVAAVTACAPKTLKTPVMLVGAETTPLDLVPPEYRDNEIDVLFATDRMPKKRAGAGAPGASYLAERGLALRLGVVTVRLGDGDDDWDSLHHQTIEKGTVPGGSIRAIDEFGPLWTTIPSTDREAFDEAQASTRPSDPIREPSTHFAETINAWLTDVSCPEIFVYVPGYNTSFATAIYRTAEFCQVAGRDGIFIAYSWPAQSNPFNYVGDSVTARVSARNLRQFLIYLGEETNARRIHVLSYSAGAPIVTEALLQLRLIHAGSSQQQIRDSLRLGSIVYAGSDEDVDLFRNLFMDSVEDLCESFTVYTSSSDAGLGMSRSFMSGTPRLGSPMDALTESDLESLRRSSGEHGGFVDVSEAMDAAGRGDIFAHGYWYLNPWVSGDIFMNVRYGLSPEERGLVRSEDDPFWNFPDDYDVRVREIYLREERELRERR